MNPVPNTAALSFFIALHCIAQLLDWLGMQVRIRVGSWAHTNMVKTALAKVLFVGSWVCFGIGFWIIAAGLQWAETFLVRTGAFSHWQVWIAFGVALQLAAFRLKRPNRQLIS